MNETLQFRRFAGDRKGAVAIIFALVAFVMLSLVGLTIDLGRGLTLRSALQVSADAAALNGAAVGETFSTDLLTEVQESALRRAIARGATTVSTYVRWVSETDYEVAMVAPMPTSFLAAVPSMPAQLTIIARSVARSHKLKVVAAAPSKKDVSYEAADYNQVWVYCYNKDWQRTGTRTSTQGSKFVQPASSLAFAVDLAGRENKNGRADFTLIADNGGTSINFSMPKCLEGESVSYMLFNSRNNRTSPSKWSKNYTTCGTALSQTGKTCYTWYTDTTLDADGVEQHGGTSPYQLETVLCNDADCATTADGGTIPANHSVNRIPQRTSKKCEPGKFMYMGWEDRPPQNQGGNGTGNPYPAGQSDPGGDRDYDDIRLIVSCPQTEKDVVNVRLTE